MKKSLIVRQSDKTSGHEHIMAEGLAEVEIIDGQTHVAYRENDEAKTAVNLVVNNENLILKREGEVQTELHFTAGKRSIGIIKSEYGSFEIELYTHKYIWNGDIIALEYDILSGNDVSDSFRVIWKLRRNEA